MRQAPQETALLHYLLMFLFPWGRNDALMGIMTIRNSLRFCERGKRAMPKLLTDIQRSTYEREGIVFPLRVLSASDALHYRTACDELETHLGGKPRTVEVRQMHLHLRWAYDLATCPRVLDAVEDILGPNLLIWATELFAKHPQDTTVSIGWHRDRTYMGFAPQASITAWIALSDSTPANGCMRAVPGPRRFDVPDKSHGKRPTAIEVNEQEAIDVILSAGEMSLHDDAILHGSGPNHSREKRVGFAIRFITPEACPPQEKPPVILARGEDRSDRFCIVAPPENGDVDTALANLRVSAALHFEAMLQLLRRSVP